MSKTPERSIKKKTGTPNRSKTTAAGDTLHHLAFDNSILAHIITTTGSGKIISVNTAACNLLGYSKKALLAKKRSGIFDIKEAAFKEMLKERSADGNATATLTAIKKSGRHFPCEITTAVFMDEDGIEKSVTTIADMSESILKQKVIDIEKEKIVAADIVAAVSKQKAVDVKKNKLVSYNIALAKSKQKDVDIKKDKIVAHNIVVAKSKQKSIDAKNQKIVSADILRAAEKSGKAMISYANKVRNKLLKEIEISFRAIFDASSDVLFDTDLLANKVTINDAYEKEFGYKKKDNVTGVEDWLNHIHQEDKEAATRDYNRMLRSSETEWKYSFRFLKADDSVVKVLVKGIILRSPSGEAYRRIVFLLDISKEKVLEEKMEQQIRLKEKQFEQAMEDAKYTERSDIGKELHDNVNQLLAASRMYLEMAKRGGPNSEMYLSRSSEYTLTAIEEIRKLTKGLTTDFIRNLGLCDAIDNLSQDTMETNPIKITASCTSFKEQSISDKFKLNVYRVVQEQLNNILKHAQASAVNISLLQSKKFIKLIISDNGKGFDTEKKHRGIGIPNIKSRAATYNGIAEFVSREKQGCVLTVKFPYRVT
jgi:PAS domain S-box-containing protein